MTKKKILFISNIAGKQIGAFAMASIKAATDLEFEYHIAENFDASSIEQRKKDEKQYGIKIHHIDFVRNPLHPQNFKAYKQLLDLIKREKFDVIHCNTPVGGIYGRLASKKCCVNKVIYQVHGFHFYEGAPKLNWIIYYPIEKFMAKITDVLITINTEDYELAKKFKLRNNGKLFYVPGVGINTEIYKNHVINRNKLRKEMGFNEDDILLISVGRLDANKNNSTIIRAVNKVNNKNLHLLICGDGVEREKLESLTKELKVENQIHFLGNRLDMNDLYHIADIFVMASYREGLSRSIMEAMSCGLPCIVSDIRGNRDLILNTVGGYLIDPNSYKDFAEKISTLKNLNKRKKISEFNLKSIEKFNINIVVGELRKIYSSFLF